MINDTGSGYLHFEKPHSHPYDNIAPLASRLGVHPAMDDTIPHLLVCGTDGVKYDVFELINAFLDRIDRAIK